MILQETIDNVNSLNIVEVIGRYVELKRSGSNYKGLSPFSGERTASFMVSPAKGIFKDFSSGKGGNVVNFIMEKEHFNYPEAIKHLCNMFGLEYKETEKTNEEDALYKKKEGMFLINKIATEYYIANYAASPEATSYLRDRNFTPEIIAKFNIGYAPQTFSGITNHLINNGYSWTMGVETSLIGHLVEKNKLYDRFRNRIMFPIKNRTGNIIGFGGRALEFGDKIPKYLNSSDSILYDKSKSLYGIFESRQAIAMSNKCFLTEGYTDVIAWHQSGVENIVASSGTSLTEEQAKMINKLTKNVTVMFDADSAGLRATIRGIDILLAEGMRVKVLQLPTGQDPDDFAKGKSKDEILEYVYVNEKDFLIFKLHHLLKDAGDDFTLRNDAVNDVVNSISKIPDPVGREIYLEECCRIAKVNIESLRIALKKYTEEMVDFSMVNTSAFSENLFKSKSFMKEQCERKILQYILAYGKVTIEFKEVESVPITVDDVTTFDDRVFLIKRTVLEKVINELDADGIIFGNPFFSAIYERCKEVDLSDINLLKPLLTDEAFLMAKVMADEELNMHQSAFTNTDIIGNDVVEQELHIALGKSINESLMFYKSMYIEEVIEEQSKEENIDTEMIQNLVQLLIKIKRELNFI